MKLLKTAIALVLVSATSAFASAPDERELWEMLKRSSMTRTDGMATTTVQKGSDAEETARILDPNIANP